MTYELSYVRDFIAGHFPAAGDIWRDQITATFGRQPVSTFIAVESSTIVGFAAFDSTARGFFGPTGVAESHRGKSIGKALLVASLWALHDLGYAYGIIGGAGPVGFYEKVLGSVYEIPDSTPGVYMGGAERLTPPWTPPSLSTVKEET
jgi:GNAT superfamily N-acetyltransferase